MPLKFPVDSFGAFQGDLGEPFAGRLKAEVIESKETIVAVLDH